MCSICLIFKHLNLVDLSMAIALLLFHALKTFIFSTMFKLSIFVLDSYHSFYLHVGSKKENLGLTIPEQMLGIVIRLSHSFIPHYFVGGTDENE